ncbi:MAG: hypothetical protein K2I70_06095 [Bacilli bacterium]|nr:hypothetical protein [Bacilli bacterium]
MFDIIRSYIAKEDYYLIILSNGIYVKNYQKLIGIKDDEVLIEIDKNIYKIKGSNFILTKSIEREVMIKGLVESVIRL